MALVVGTNTWATIAQADEYLTTRMGSGKWFDLPESPANPGEESKETFLVMAFNILVNKGGFSLIPELTDTNVIYAQSEMAFQLFSDLETFEDGADIMNKGLKSFKLSQWQEEYFANSEGDFALPYMVENFLTEYRLDNVFVDITVD